ncbi:hypothetical protein [Helicobacter cholecystus]|uniref:hypothetical protein n=1 Tax=Helicobacter cholecystus TaxID=45498 RepID=UPI002738D298|nr:hypothetical protein [Helicobacter cholecystus]
MKIEFKKITDTPKSFSLQSQGVKLSGEVRRISAKLFEIKAHLEGEITLVCDRSAQEYQEPLNEVLVLYISNGVWDVQSQSDLIADFDVVEFFDGFIDFEYILESEIHSIQMDYHIKEGV